MLKLTKKFFLCLTFLFCFSVTGRSNQADILIENIAALEVDPSVESPLKNTNVFIILNIMHDFTVAIANKNADELKEFECEMKEYVCAESQQSDYGKYSDDAEKMTNQMRFVCEFIQDHLLPQYTIEELMVFNILYECFENLIVMMSSL